MSKGVKQKMFKPWIILALIYTFLPVFLVAVGVILALIFKCDSVGAEVVCERSPAMGKPITYLIYSAFLGVLTIPTGGILTGILIWLSRRA
jgi:ABC-type Fe3+ transport system permease subunit